MRQVRPRANLKSTQGECKETKKKSLKMDEVKKREREQRGGKREKI